jgi:hypothetical protein
MIQFQTDPKRMPLEDPGRAWDEALSPFQKVATIKIPVPPPPAPGLFKRLRLALGNILGAIVSLAMNSLTQILGKLAGYRDEVWTNWYRRPFIFGMPDTSNTRGGDEGSALPQPSPRL